MEDDKHMLEKVDGENAIIRVLKAILKINIIAFKGIMRFIVQIFSFMSRG